MDCLCGAERRKKIGHLLSSVCTHSRNNIAKTISPHFQIVPTCHDLQVVFAVLNKSETILKNGTIFKVTQGLLQHCPEIPGTIFFLPKTNYLTSRDKTANYLN